jgi:hypothetical protein
VATLSNLDWKEQSGKVVRRGAVHSLDSKATEIV